MHDLPDHGDTNRPWRISYREAEVRVVGPLILSFLHIMDDLGDSGKHVGREVLREDENTAKHIFRHAARTLARRSLKSGFKYSADCRCVAAASLPCVVRLTSSTITKTETSRRHWREVDTYLADRPSTPPTPSAPSSTRSR